MTDLKRGILELGNTGIYPGVSASEMQENEEIQIRKGKRMIRLFSRQGHDLQLADVPFTMEACFAEGQIWYVRLCPHLSEDEVPDYPDAAYQKRKWDLCTEVLVRLLGAPQMQSAEEVQYTFSWGRISCAQILRGKNPYTDGNIRITYLTQEDR